MYLKGREGGREWKEGGKEGKEGGERRVIFVYIIIRICVYMGGQAREKGKKENKGKSCGVCMLSYRGEGGRVGREIIFRGRV